MAKSQMTISTPAASPLLAWYVMFESIGAPPRICRRLFEALQWNSLVCAALLRAHGA